MLRRPRPLASPFAPHALVAFAALALLLPGLRDGLATRAAHRTPLPLAADAPLVRQSHPQGCGAALLATLAARAGRPVGQEALLAAEPPGPDGISLAAFARLARGEGLNGRWLRVRGDVAVVAPPFVAHLHDPAGHFVWVASGVGDYRRVADPASGEALWHVTTLRRRGSGHVFRLEPEVAAAVRDGGGA